MEKLKRTLIRIADDPSAMKDLLLQEYNNPNLLRVYTTVVAKGPKRLSKSWTNLFTALQSVLKKLYTNPTTFNVMVSKFRKPIKTDPSLDLEIYRQSLVILGRTREEAQQQSEEYRAKVAARNADRASYPVLYVEDVFDLMDRLINSNDPYELTLAVALATASRSVEIFKVSRYFEVDGQPNQIKVVGIAKDKGNNNFADVVLVRNLVHLTSDQVLEAIETIRSDFDLDRLSNQKISSMTNTALNKAFREHVIPLFTPQDKSYLKTLSSHKCRYISGYISYLVYAKPKRIPEESYLQAQLGHLSPESTKSYLGINIRFKQKIVKHAPEEVQQLFTHEMKSMSEKIDKRCPEQIQVDLSQYRNSYRRSETNDEKVSKVVAALQHLKDCGMKLTQKEIRSELGYSSDVMSAAYKKARSL